MTIDEALGWLDTARLVLINQCRKDAVDSYVEAFGLAISALRAQQEAEKGCKYCRDGDAIALDSCSAIRIERESQNYVVGGSDWESEINYCPMCGRNLRPTKEAHND